MHIVPFPKKPSLHRHSKLPGVSEQLALTSQLCCPVSHSLISNNIIMMFNFHIKFRFLGYLLRHISPVPKYPTLQEQFSSCLPLALTLQKASVLHLLFKCGTILPQTPISVVRIPLLLL